MTVISAIPLDVAEPAAQTPKKRKSSLKAVLQEFESMSKTMVEQEGLLSPSQAGLILEVSARRVSELVELGKLTRFDFLGRTYVSSREVAARREMDLKAGRPARGTMAKLKMTLKAVAQMDVPQLAVIATNEPPKTKKKEYFQSGKYYVGFARRMRLREISVAEKVRRGMALNLSELAECTGYCRSELTEMVPEGLPLFHGKSRLPDFWRWVRRQALKACLSAPVDRSLQQDADKLYGQS